MSVKVTVIADKDLGHVLGAVTEVNAEAKLEVGQVVGKSGLAVRNGKDGAVMVAAAELQTFLSAGDGPIYGPFSYVVKDGVPQAVASTVTISSVAANSIGVAFSTAPSGEVKAKAITHRRSDDVHEVTQGRIPTGGTTIGVTLRAGEHYDVLVLVEGYSAAFEEDQTAT